MDLSKLLNDCDDETAIRPSWSSTCRPCQDHSRPPTSTFPSAGHHAHQPTSLASLTPLQSALPDLTRHNSDYSESAHSPVTPEYTPEATPCLAVKPDQNRHRPADPKRPSIHHRDVHTIQGSAFAPPDHMDPYSVPDFMGGAATSEFQLPLAQSVPRQLPLPQTPASSTASLVCLDKSAYPPPPRTAPKASTKKNSYPCPVAKQYNCSEHFTTSGHAARHAKKHTGKKDAICPECNKAFTRKDNMEQHRRTHSSTRMASKLSTAEDSRQRKVMKLQQQQQQQQQKKKSKVSQADAMALPADPEMVSQGMSAAIINPHPSVVHTDPMQGMLDPQLRADQAMFPDMTANMVNSAFWDQQQIPMSFMQNQSAMSSNDQLNHSRATIQRDTYRNEIYHHLGVETSASSPSASPTSSRGDPQSPSRLDTLAFAASTRLE